MKPMNTKKITKTKNCCQRQRTRVFSRYRYTGMFFAVLFLFLFLFPVSARAEGWERQDEVFVMPDQTPIEGAIARGIDVSYWKKEIDWEQVAASDVDFAMLGTRFRGEVDPYFPVNAQKARESGLEVGAYIYSYATTVEMAEQEADFVLDLIKDYEISYPVAFDAEDSNTLGTLSPQQVSEVINAFCRKIEAAGYYPMLYANEYWLNNKIDLSMIHYDIWVARYNTMYTFASPSMWQATNTGNIPGVDGNVDIDFLFTDYSLIIPADTWRTIAGNRYYYQNHRMQKETWIHDKINWYYLNEAGNPENGWQQINGTWYYLAETGAMQTGWQQVNGAWYYLDASGAMQTGWQQVNGAWYYLNASGAMQTGWQQVNGVWYYLDASGAMQTGWQQVNGVWYYLDASGAMQTGWQQIDGQVYYFDLLGGQMLDAEAQHTEALPNLLP